MKYLDPKADLTFKRIFGEHPDKIIEGLQLIMVELPKFQPQTFAGKRMQVLWLRFLTEIDENTRQVPEELLFEPEIKKALTVLEESAFSEAEIAGYDYFWDMVSVDRMFREGALLRGLAEGKAEGLAEGHAEGLAAGKAEGLAEGEAKEKARVLQIAINMKRSGMDLLTIIDCTGLSTEEIQSL